MSEAKRYQRALVKISGEALAGDSQVGLDREAIRWIAGQISQARALGCQLGVVVGGGNIIRGVDALAVGVPPLVADHMGMIATVLNALAMRAALEALNIPARALSAFPVGRFIEPFEREKALDYLNSGCVLVFGGGTGNPCFTTDSAAALRALEIEAEVMIKATQVSGVFDKDPKKHSDAVFIQRITPHEVISRGLGVMDAASVEILGRKSIPTIVLDLHVDGNIARALAGETVGTTIV